MSAPELPIPRFPASAADHLSRHGWAVVPQFYPEWKSLQQDVLDLRSEGHFKVAKIGQDGLVQDEATPFRDIRYSESCMLSEPKVLLHEDGQETKHNDTASQFVAQAPKLPENTMRQHLLQTVQTLKHDLQTAAMEAQSETSKTTNSPSSLTEKSTNTLSSLQMPLDEQLHEIMYLYYPSGGYYKRHVDAEPSSASSWRQYSFLLYMNDDHQLNKSTAGPTGGQLRLYRDSGDDELPHGELPNFVNIDPTGGTLVVFVSDMVPHEVLATTSPQRCAVVGWFLSSIQSQQIPLDHLTATTRPPLRVCDTLKVIAPDTLRALRDLRDAVPMLKDKLEPKQTDPDPTTGLIQPTSILDDWGIVMPSTTESSHSTTSSNNTTTAPPTPLLPDTDPRYWKPIVTFDEQGHVVTAGWGGLRLRRLVDTKPLLEPALWHDGSLTTVDLANTFLSPSTLTQLLQVILERCTTSWCQCYLGTNGLGQDAASFVQLIPYLATVQVLDLRYNDFGDNETVLSTLLASCPRLEKLYLEGNRLGDTGVTALLQSVNASTGTKCRLRELYLGQNDIGPEGAKTLAQALVDNGPLSACEKLYLEGNCIGPSGAQAFREVLLEYKDTIRLQKLYVDNNQIGKQDSIALGAALNSATVIGDSAFSQ